MKALEELKAAFAAATPGEWRANGFTDEGWEVYAEEYGLLLETYDRDVGVDTGKANAHLIALMKNSLPALIECAEALNAIYNRIPTSAIPSEFIGGEGNWGLTEEENALAVIAATALAKLEQLK